MISNKSSNFLNLVWKMVSYNLRIIFANKFIWFLTGSVVFYLGLSVIYVFANNVSKMEDLYGVFLFSGLLLVFYPAVLVFRMTWMPELLRSFSEYLITDIRYGL